jgi:hypothetical protein
MTMQLELISILIFLGYLLVLGVGLFLDAGRRFLEEPRKSSIWRLPWPVRLFRYVHEDLSRKRAARK